MPEETRSANLAVAAFVKVGEFLEVILLIQSIILNETLSQKKQNNKQVVGALDSLKFEPMWRKHILYHCAIRLTAFCS